MTIETSWRADKQSSVFLVLYAMAVAGGSVAYAPFLTVILPVRVGQIVGSGAVEVLSYIAFVGAIAASLSNLLAGWLSDRTHSRRGWILVGLTGSCLLLISMRYVQSTSLLFVMIFAWQTALNLMLNPLSAWAGDYVPDGQKGLLGGLLSLAPGVGALAGALVTIPQFVAADDRLVIIAALVAALVLPAVLFARPRPMPQLMEECAGALSSPCGRGQPSGWGPRTKSVWRMWLARLLVQIAEAALFAFLLLWLGSIDPSVTDNNVATIFTFVLFASVPIALIAGKWSDREGRPMVPLIVAAACCGIGLLTMAGSKGAVGGVAGYCLFGIAAAVFLALHSSQTLRVLPSPRHRGRDLGIFNLTNTVPSLIMPGLTLALIPMFGFQGLFAILAIFMLISGLLLRTRRLG